MFELFNHLIFESSNRAKAKIKTMTKQQVLELWMEGDGDAVSKALDISPQLISYWKLRPAATTEREAEILEFLSRRMANRRLVPRLVPVEMELAQA